jgi:Ca2+/Na+ antiporter
MKKWMIIVAILICCVLYALVKFCKPQSQNETDQTENPPIEVQADVGEPNNAPSAEDSDSAVPAAQVEAIVKVYNEFQNALKNKDYEKAWKCTSKYFRQRESGGNFENFRDKMIAKETIFAQAIIHPDTAFNMDDLVGFLYTGPYFKEDLYLFFIQEDGQWKLYIGKEASDVTR